MIEEQELKDCPFCGGGARYGMIWDTHFVCCKKCGAMVEVYNTKKKAVTAWNMRVTKDR